MKRIWLTLIFIALPIAIISAQVEVHTVYFNRNSSSVVGLNSVTFNSFLANINTQKIDSISVYGYSDYLGSPSYNMELSQKRAQNVFNQLKTINNTNLNTILEYKTNIVGLGEIPSLKRFPEGIPSDRKVNIIFHITPPKHSFNNSNEQRYFRPEVGMKFNQSYILEKVYFVGNKADIIEASLPQLEELYKQIKQLDNDYKLVINGHICCLENDATDDDKAFSKALSTARAIRVKEFLVNKGISEKHIEYNGHSFNSPLIYPELTAEDRQKNRRIEVIVYK